MGLHDLGFDTSVELSGRGIPLTWLILLGLGHATGHATTSHATTGDATGDAAGDAAGDSAGDSAGDAAGDAAGPAGAVGRPLLVHSRSGAYRLPSCAPAVVPYLLPACLRHLHYHPCHPYSA